MLAPTFETRFGVADVDFFSVDFIDFSASSSSCTARLNSSTVVSRLSRVSLSFFVVEADADADAGGRPRFLGTAVGVEVMLASADGVDGEADEVGVGPDDGDGASFGVLVTAPGRNENRTDFLGTEPPDFSVGGFRIGLAGELASTIWSNLKKFHKQQQNVQSNKNHQH